MASTNPFAADAESKADPNPPPSPDPPSLVHTTSAPFSLTLPPSHNLSHLSPSGLFTNLTEPKTAFNFITDTLLANDLHLTALELHHELTIRGFTANTLPCLTTLTSTLTTLPLPPPPSPLFTPPFGTDSIASAFTTRDHRIAVLEHELRCAEEDTEDLQVRLRRSSTVEQVPLPVAVDAEEASLSLFEGDVLAALIKRYLTSHGHALTAVTFSSERQVDELEVLGVAASASLETLYRRKIGKSESFVVVEKERDALKTRVEELEEEVQVRTQERRASEFAE